MPKKIKVTLVQFDGHLDLHIGYFVSDKLFLSDKPTLLTSFFVDRVLLNLSDHEQDL